MGCLKLEPEFLEDQGMETIFSKGIKDHVKVLSSNN